MSSIAPRIALARCRSRIIALSNSNASTSVVRSFSLLASQHRQDGPIPAAAAMATPTPVSYYSSSLPTHEENNNTKKEFAKLTRLEDANPERIHGIEVNPESLGHGVLPGNLIYKTYKLTGNTRKVPLKLAHGYFWMVTDLKKTDSKPTLSNTKLIPQKDAQLFPTLEGLTTLEDLGTDIELPIFFLEQAHNLQNNKKKNGAKGGGKVSLVAISFRDNGFQVLPSWMDPFEEEFSKSKDQSKVQTFSVSITERWALYPIRNTVKRVMKKNTPHEKHASTLAYFGTKEVMDFRDILRMHNIMAGYVFLLDDLGRVRFAGSGEASPEEVEKLVGFAKELIQESEGGSKTKKGKNRR